MDPTRSPPPSRNHPDDDHNSKFSFLPLLQKPLRYRSSGSGASCTGGKPAFRGKVWRRCREQTSVANVDDGKKDNEADNEARRRHVWTDSDWRRNISGNFRRQCRQNLCISHGRLFASNTLDGSCIWRLRVTAILENNSPVRGE